jgi:hypothetical protein
MAIDYSEFAFSKPGDIDRVPLLIIEIMPDGREIINTKITEGLREYRRRIADMLARQKHICCLFGWIAECPGHLHLRESTFEHEGLRRDRDDRIVLPDGRWINGAAHKICNNLKGSRRIPYNEIHNAPKAISRRRASGDALGLLQD